jgi:DNA-binding beta-propeller fold protein YncE
MLSRFCPAIVVGVLVVLCAARTDAQSSSFSQKSPAREFPARAQWLNSRPLTKADLKGKFVLLDFWTYCCINCMHILPELKKLEHEFPTELVVIGVHSAKFETERVTDNIREAILRYEIAHPVINDASHELWDSYRVDTWPTIVLIDPEGMVVWRRSSEFKADEVQKKISAALPYYRNRRLLDQRPLQLSLESAKEQATPLRFPGKILADEAGDRLFISDSNHNRIVIATPEGSLIDTIGSGASGKSDGDFRSASFNHPQGCALAGDSLYVADTENHLIRKVDLTKKTVTTVAGTGQQGTPLNAFPGWNGRPIKVARLHWAGRPKSTPLSSPWALAIHNKDLLMAMAGYHQIWKMPLDGSEIGPFAGNGREDVVDGPRLTGEPYEDGSSFAQPSGLATDGTWLYVADSEGSSIRAVPLEGNKDVRTVVGSSFLRADRLFAFGDVDGAARLARLQHCLEVAVDGDKLYVADTYNHKIKVIDAKTGQTKTFAGTGRPGTSDNPAQFREPAGAAALKGKLYVADTNNHLIRTIQLATGKVATLTIAGLTAPEQPQSGSLVNAERLVTAAPVKPDFEGAQQEHVRYSSVKAADGVVNLHVSLKLPPGWKMNPLAPMSYWLDSPRASGPADRAAFGRTKLDQPTAEFEVPVRVSGAGEDEVAVSLSYYYCQTKDEGVCKVGAVVFTVPLNISADGQSTPIKLVHRIPGS